MTRIVVQRLAWSLVVVWFVVTAAFAMVTLIPADPAKAMLGPHATAETIERVRAHYCLDEGLLGQYGCFLERLARGDLGESYYSKRPVGELILDRLWPTVQLALATILLQIAIGVPLGIAAAARRGRWQDRAVGLAGLLGQSLPTFFVGTMLVYALAYGLGWFPIAGYGAGASERLHHLVLPAFTLATFSIAYYARLVRSELVETLHQDYVRTARAKGLSERDVLVRHALRNAVGPLVALAGIDLGVLLGGTVVTEYIFAWPGLGRELLQAILEVDLPLILGVVLVSAIAIAIANLVADLVQLWIDPRLRDGA